MSPQGWMMLIFFHPAFQQHFFTLQKDMRRTNKPKNPFSFVQLCNCAPSWLQFPKHFSPPPSALLSWISAIWTVRGAREEVMLDKFIDHCKRKRILYRLLNKEAWQKKQWDSTYTAPCSLYPAIARNWQYQSQKSRCWDKKPTLGHWIHSRN